MADRSPTLAADDLRVLIFMSGGRDAAALPGVLAEAGIASFACSSVTELCREIRAGAGTILVTEEAVQKRSDFQKLTDVLKGQPIWSDLPVIFLTHRGQETVAAASAYLLPTDVTLVERPVRVKTLVAAVRSVLRNRQRQYLVRNQLSALADAQLVITAARDAAQESSKAKGDFLANMSHEMRTPLAGTLGMVQLVLQTDLGEEQRHLLEMAEGAGNSLLKLISDILDLSKLEAGKLAIADEPFDLRQCVASAVEIVLVRAQEKGVELVSAVDASVPELIRGDKGRLRQILVNLLGNAVKFTDRGRVEVLVRVDEAQEPGRPRLLFAVKDTGIGIAPEDIEKLFNRFSQVNDSISKRFGGTGIGLALSRHLVEELGGSIGVESSIGKGSTFFFTLPLRSADGE